jgi:threonine dehydrogenase-like Zn-dependent dehydrogenase
MGEILDGSRGYPLSLPLTPGGSAIGRIEEVGPDAVHLAKGQLVFCDVTIRARDNPSVSILFGIHGGGYPEAQKLMDGEWRDGTYSEFAKFPLENLYPLNENVLLNQRGFTVPELAALAVCLVPFGGLSEIGLSPGDSVIVAPATGYYGGAAVSVAIAMGATVVAAGRNKTALDNLAAVYASTGRLKTVVLSGNSAEDTDALRRASLNSEGADAFIDLSPPEAANATHITSAMCALRPFGKCVLMGGAKGNFEFPYLTIMFKNLRIQGRFMYERDHILKLIKLIERGSLGLGKAIGIKNLQKFDLDHVMDAVTAAAASKGWGSQVLLTP